MTRPVSQPSCLCTDHVPRCLGRSWMTTLVPKGASGVRLQSKTPNTWSWADSFRLMHDLQRKSSVWTAFGMRPHQRHFGKALSHPARMEMKWLLKVYTACSAGLRRWLLGEANWQFGLFFLMDSMSCVEILLSRHWRTGLRPASVSWLQQVFDSIILPLENGSNPSTTNKNNKNKTQNGTHLGEPLRCKQPVTQQQFDTMETWVRRIESLRRQKRARLWPTTSLKWHHCRLRKRLNHEQDKNGQTALHQHASRRTEGQRLQNSAPSPRWLCPTRWARLLWHHQHTRCTGHQQSNWQCAACSRFWTMVCCLECWPTQTKKDTQPTDVTSRSVTFPRKPTAPQWQTTPVTLKPREN